MSNELGVRKLYRPDVWAGLVLWVGVFAVYVLTLAPGALGGDPGELQFVPHILSLPHPTGTPLYVLLGKLWSALPLGSSVAWRMNLLAAVSASLAVLVVFRTVFFQVERVVPALAAALALAFGLTFWEQALMADKYAFNALMVALVLYLALRWGTRKSPRTLNLLALTYGLSLAHHRTMVLFAPALLGYVWWHERGSLWRDGRRLLRLALLCLCPLLLYLYLPWAASRNLPPGTWQPQSWQEWLDYFLDRAYLESVGIDRPAQSARIFFYLQTLVTDFTWPGALVGVVGLLAQLRRRWVDGLFLLVNFAVQAFLACNYDVPRHWVFFLPSFLIFTLWVGEGFGVVWLGAEWLRSRRRKAGIAAILVLAVVMLGVPLAPFLQRYRPLRENHLGAGTLDIWRQALKEGHAADRLGSAIADVERDAVIVCDWEQATPLWYYQQVEGLQGDVRIFYPVERLEEAAAGSPSLYIARSHPGLSDRWHPSSVGPLIALRADPATEPPPDIAPLGIRLGSAFELIGYSAGEAAFHPGTVVPLTLYWRALQVPEHDYSVSVRLLDGAMEEVAKVDIQNPVLGTYPTSRWMAGEVVGDYYELELPSNLPPGRYRWGVILYRSLEDGDWENLKVGGTGSEIAMGGEFTVSAR
ncbi:DUF2723 domain-containing protein [Chloroflexota bacterium]